MIASRSGHRYRFETVNVVERVRRSMGFERVRGAVLDATLVMTLDNQQLLEIVSVNQVGNVLSIDIRRTK